MPTSVSQPSVYVCSNILLHRRWHWAELLRPQRWAGVTACSPSNVKQSKVLTPLVSRLHSMLQ